MHSNTELADDNGEAFFRFASGFLGQVQDQLDAEFEASLGNDEESD